MSGEEDELDESDEFDENDDFLIEDESEIEDFEIDLEEPDNLEEDFHSPEPDEELGNSSPKPPVQLNLPKPQQMQQIQQQMQGSMLGIQLPGAAGQPAQVYLAPVPERRSRDREERSHKKETRENHLQDFYDNLTDIDFQAVESPTHSLDTRIFTEKQRKNLRIIPKKTPRRDSDRYYVICMDCGRAKVHTNFQIIVRIYAILLQIGCECGTHNITRVLTYGGSLSEYLQRKIRGGLIYFSPEYSEYINRFVIESIAYQIIHGEVSPQFTLADYSVDEILQVFLYFLQQGVLPMEVLTPYVYDFSEAEIDEITEAWDSFTREQIAAQQEEVMQAEAQNDFKPPININLAAEPGQNASPLLPPPTENQEAIKPVVRVTGKKRIALSDLNAPPKQEDHETEGVDETAPERVEIAPERVERIVPPEFQRPQLPPKPIERTVIPPPVQEDEAPSNECEAENPLQRKKWYQRIRQKIRPGS